MYTSPTRQYFLFSRTQYLLILPPLPLCHSCLSLEWALLIVEYSQHRCHIGLHPVSRLKRMNHTASTSAFDGTLTTLLLPIHRSLLFPNVSWSIPLIPIFYSLVHITPHILWYPCHVYISMFQLFIPISTHPPWPYICLSNLNLLYNCRHPVLWTLAGRSCLLSSVDCGGAGASSPTDAYYPDLCGSVVPAVPFVNLSVVSYIFSFLYASCPIYLLSLSSRPLIHAGPKYIGSLLDCRISI